MDWQPIETAPRDGTEVILYDGRDRFIGAYVRGYWHNLHIDFPCVYTRVTHWMHLPEPPSDR